MPSGIRGSANRPKLAKHLRNTKEKTFTNTTQADRDREHSITDAWAERRRLETQAAEEAQRSTIRDEREARNRSRTEFLDPR